MNSEKFRNFDFECAIFDLDGTLLNSTGIWAKIDERFLEKRNIEPTREFLEVIKTHNFKTGSEFTVRHFNLPERPEDVADEWYRMALKSYAEEIVLKPYAKEYLKELKLRGIKLSVATSSDRSLYESCLIRNGVYDLFDNFTQTDEVYRGKGFPDVYIKAAQKSHADISECVVYEDILRGVEGAKNGGFFTVAVEDEASLCDKDNIIKLADIYIDNYKKLIML